MGLIGLLRKVKFRERELRLLFIGLENSGKTSIINSFLETPNTSVSPTQGFTINNTVKSDYNLSLWDLSGAAVTRSSWHSFFEGSDGVIFVVDGADKTRFEEAKKELATAISKDRSNSISWLLLVNKQDLPGCALAPEITEILKLRELSGKNINVMECSAVNNEGVVESINWILNDIVTRSMQQ
jgi:ADP-ribosylation factor-like protein 2